MYPIYIFKLTILL